MCVIKFLDISGASPYAPLCIVSALLSGVGSAVGSAITAGANAKMQADSQRWQTSEREASQVYNTSEREASQAYQTSEREAQNAYAERMYKNYSSPEAMARQYASAGLNPRLAMDGSSAGSVTSGGGSNGGAPSGTSALAPTSTPPYLPSDSLASGFVNIAGALKSLAEAKKVGVDISEAKAMFDDRVKDMKYKAMASQYFAMVGQYVQTEKDRKEIEELGVKIAQGLATKEQIEETTRGLKIRNKIDQNELDHWLESYDLKTREVESGINRNTVLNNQSAQDIEESRSRVALNNLDRKQKNQLFGLVKASHLLDVVNKGFESQEAFQRAIISALESSNLQLYGTRELPQSIVSSIYSIFEDQVIGYNDVRVNNGRVTAEQAKKVVEYIMKSISSE